MSFELLLVIIEVTEPGVNLAQCQIRVLFVEFICAPAVGQVLAHQFDHLQIDAFYPCDPSVIQHDMTTFFDGAHRRKLASQPGGFNLVMPFPVVTNCPVS